METFVSYPAGSGAGPGGTRPGRGPGEHADATPSAERLDELTSSRDLCNYSTTNVISNLNLMFIVK